MGLSVGNESWHRNNCCHVALTVQNYRKTYKGGNVNGKSPPLSPLQCTIYDLVVQTLQIQEHTHIPPPKVHPELIPDLLDLLSTQASSQLASSVSRQASSIYESELQEPHLKQVASTSVAKRQAWANLRTSLSLRWAKKIQDLAPNPLDFAWSSLDVEPTHWHTAPLKRWWWRCQYGISWYCYGCQWKW